MKLTIATDPDSLISSEDAAMPASMAAKLTGMTVERMQELINKGLFPKPAYKDEADPKWSADAIGEFVFRRDFYRRRRIGLKQLSRILDTTETEIRQMIMANCLPLPTNLRWGGYSWSAWQIAEFLANEDYAIGKLPPWSDCCNFEFPILKKEKTKNKEEKIKG